MTDDLDDLEKKLAQFRAGEKLTSAPSQSEMESQRTGMKAGSEFMAYVFAGGLLGYGLGHFLGNMPLWMILMLFAGFGVGTWRAYLTMNK